MVNAPTLLKEACVHAELSMVQDIIPPQKNKFLHILHFSDITMRVANVN